MDKELKHNWTHALRSGEYKQGKRFLRSSSDEYCCLGVICDLYDPEAWEYGDYSTFYAGDYSTFYAGENCHISSILPFWRVLGRDGCLHYPVIFGGLTSHSLAELNDKGAPFSFIADVIDQQF
jgi:hypothetical protein